jgi:hypothetical protein
MDVIGHEYVPANPNTVLRSLFPKVNESCMDMLIRK